MLFLKQALTCLMASIATPFAYILGADSDTYFGFPNSKALVLKNTPPFFSIITPATPTSESPVTHTLKVIRADIAQTVLVEYTSVPSTAVIYDTKPEAELGLATFGPLRANRTTPQPRSSTKLVALGATVLAFCTSFWLQLTRKSKKPRKVKVTTTPKPSDIEVAPNTHASPDALATQDTHATSGSDAALDANAAPDVSATSDVNTTPDTVATPDSKPTSNNVLTDTEIPQADGASTLSNSEQTDPSSSPAMTSDADSTTDSSPAAQPVIPTPPPTEIKLRGNAPIFMPRALPMQEIDVAEAEVSTPGDDHEQMHACSARSEFDSKISDTSSTVPAQALVQELPVAQIGTEKGTSHDNGQLQGHDAEEQQRGRSAKVIKKLWGRMAMSLPPSPKSVHKECCLDDTATATLDTATLALSDALRDKIDQLIRDARELRYFGTLDIEPESWNKQHIGYELEPSEELAQPEDEATLDTRPASPQAQVEQTPAPEQPQGQFLVYPPPANIPAYRTLLHGRARARAHALSRPSPPAADAAVRPASHLWPASRPCPAPAPATSFAHGGHRLRIWGRRPRTWSISITGLSLIRSTCSSTRGRFHL
ncbi:hypothetical protein EVG20_g5942, partial [Dentipellis fragilis]